MAGYKLTFDGSLVEKRDVVQSTGNSSLIETVVTTVSPASWDNITSVATTLYSGTSPTAPNTYTEGTFLGPTVYTVGPNYSGGNLTATLGTFSGIAFLTPNLTGTYTVSVNCKVFTGSNWTISMSRPTSSGASRNYNNSVGTLLSSQAGTSLNSFHTYNMGTHSLSNQWFWISFLNLDFVTNRPIEVNYITITESSGAAITITPSTFTSGVAPTGGVSTIAAPATLTSGQAALSTPAKLFGAKVVHDLSDIVEAKYLPPADATQDAELSMSESKYFTATATSVSVEGEGLGSAESILGGNTSVIIENAPETLEN